MTMYFPNNSKKKKSLGNWINFILKCKLNAIFYLERNDETLKELYCSYKRQRHKQRFI